MELTNLYSWALWLGFGGLLAMTLLSAGHFGGHAHGGHGHGAHAGHGHGADAGGHGGDFHLHGAGGAPAHGGSALHIGHAAHGHAGGAGHAAHGHAAHGHAAHGHAAHSHGGAKGEGGFSLMTLLSPRLWFSVALGFGATGLLLHAALREPLLFAASVAGGALGEWLLFGRVWNMGMKFASRPALTLESAVAEEAHAATNFDTDGHGLVIIELDGQVLQVLGRLNESGRREGFKVRTGDRLFVEDVDAARGQCTVSRLD